MRSYIEAIRGARTYAAQRAAIDELIHQAARARDAWAYRVAGDLQHAHQMGNEEAFASTLEAIEAVACA